jgi:hypothetical protein
MYKYVISDLFCVGEDPPFSLSRGKDCDLMGDGSFFLSKTSMHSGGLNLCATGVNLSLDDDKCDGQLYHVEPLRGSRIFCVGRLQTSNQTCVFRSEDQKCAHRFRTCIFTFSFTGLTVWDIDETVIYYQQDVL